YRDEFTILESFDNVEPGSEINHPCMQMGTLGKIAVEEPRGRGRPRDGDRRARWSEQGDDLSLVAEQSVCPDRSAARSGSAGAAVSGYGRSAPGHPAAVAEFHQAAYGAARAYF